MEKKTASAIMFTLLLASTLVSTFAILPVKAEGTIYIRADGSIDPPTTLISAVDNFTYTFTSNINGSIVIERNNITVDGAGYGPQGSGAGVGFGLSNVNNVVIKNSRVEGFAHGIYLTHSYNSTVSWNTVTNNGGSGITLSYSWGSTVSENNVTDNLNQGGIYLGYSWGNNVSGNHIENNACGIYLTWSSDNAVSENNVTNNIAGGYGGGICLIDHCDNNTISGNTVTNSLSGVQVSISSGNAVSGNKLTNNGLGLYNSSRNTVTGNHVTNCIPAGLALYYYSYDNTVSGNTMTNSNWGIWLWIGGDDNVVSGNHVANNDIGIRLENSSGNIVYHNNFANNTIQVYSSNSVNVWDDGYPSGGNYWSDYTGVDADGDGIGDTPYVMDANNQDRYPLMNSWTPVPLWPMLRHDPQCSGRTAVEGPGVSDNPVARGLLNVTMGDSFNSPIIDSQGNLFLTASINWTRGLYAFSQTGIQKWFRANRTTPILTRTGNVLTWYVAETNAKAALEMLSPDGNLLWETSLDGQYPIQQPTADDHGIIQVFTGTFSGLPHRLIAIEEETGDILWTCELEGSLRASAVGHNGVAYYAVNDTVFAISSDGTEKWHRSFPQILLDGRLIFGSDSISNLLVRNDGAIIVLVNWEKQTLRDPASGLHCIDPEDPNQERWVSYDQWFQRGMLAIGKNDDVFIAGFYDYGMSAYTRLFSFDVAGNLNWMRDVGHPAYYPTSLVVDGADRIYGQFGDGAFISFCIRAFDKNGDLIWSIVPPPRRMGVLSLGANWTLYSGGETCLYAITGVPPTPPPPPPPSDRVPPAIIENFVASSTEDKQVTLRWTNPPDVDLAEVVVLRKIEEYPDNHYGGELVYRSASPSPNAEIEFIDTALVNGRVYGYAIFGRDSSGNWNDTVIEGNNAATATPSSPANQPPEAKFVYSPSDPDLTKTWKSIVFDASSSSDDDEITLFEWDWDGNGKYDWSSGESKATFVYDQSGTYQVNLRVTDSDGARDTTSKQITTSTWGFWDRFRKDYDPPDPETEITNEDYQYIKDHLYIFTLSNDLNEYWEFRDYYDSEDSRIGSVLHGYCDSDLRKALSLEIDPQQSPGLTYAVEFLNSLREIEEVEFALNNGHKTEASHYFSSLAEQNSRWTTTRTAEKLTETLYEMLTEMVKDVSPLGYVGLSTLKLVLDCRKAATAIDKLMRLMYYNSMQRYLQLRHGIAPDSVRPYTHEEAWEDILTGGGGQDYHIPTQDQVKLDRIEDYFYDLYESYGSHLDDLTAYRWEVKTDLRLLLSEVLKRVSLVGHVVVVPHSPVEIRAYDSQGNLTGMVNGELVEHIPNSACDNETGMVGVLSTGEGIYFEVIGRGLGSYGLEIALVKTGVCTIFVASDIPTSLDERHKYTIDWAALSQGGEGVTIEVDFNADGIFEYAFTSDSELTQSEFLDQTAPPPLSVSISPLSAPILVGQSVTFTSTVSGGYTPYGYQWYVNSAPVPSATSASWTFTPSMSGIYYVYLKATDASTNTSQSETARITVATIPVGGYSVAIGPQTKAEPIIPYIALIATLTAIFTKLRPKTKRKR